MSDGTPPRVMKRNFGESATTSGGVLRRIFGRQTNARRTIRRAFHRITFRFTSRHQRGRIRARNFDHDDNFNNRIGGGLDRGRIDRSSFFGI